MERQVLGFRHMPEVAVDIFAQAGEADFFRIDRDRAGFDLRKIQNVVDQVEQIRAGRS